MKLKFDVEQGNNYFNDESEEYEAIVTKVRVIKLTYDNLEDVAQWCGGYVANIAGNRYVAFSQNGNNVLTVSPNQYLVKNENETFSRYLESDLFAKYQKVEVECKHDGFKMYNYVTKESFCSTCGKQIFKQENGEYK